MSAGGRIGSVVVAGSGIAGYSAAAMIRRRIPGVEVIVAGSPPPANALAERIASTLPSAVGFHDDAGIPEPDLVNATGASFRMGGRFEGWAADRPAYVHAYGEVGQSFGTTSFHLHWARLAQAGRPPRFEAHSPAAMLAEAGRFVHPQGDAGSPLASFEYGLNLDPARYHALLGAYLRHLGVAERPAAIADVRIDGDTGRVAALVLDDGSEVAGDLFVDCTGPGALVRSRLDDRFEDWSRWLPCDRLLLGHGPGTPDPAPLDPVSAHAAGWRWSSASRALAQHGLVYSSAHLSDSKAERVFRAGAAVEPASEPLAIRAGRRSQPWLRNCVAIGDAAVSIEPLEWTNLHLAHSAIDRIVAKMPDRDFSPVELWDYNREAAAEADRVRDFVLLHYVVSDRPRDAFWRDAAAIELPDTLAHTLTLFRERGRLPYYEEETFTRHSWAAVLFGQGVVPRRADPLVATVPSEQAAQSMTQLRERIAAMVPSFPTLGDYLRRMPPRAAR